MGEKEKNNTGAILKDVLIDYEAIVTVAKNQIVENNSKEFDQLVSKILKESESKESLKGTNKESAIADKIAESTMIQKPIGEVVKEESAPAAINMKEASLSEVEAAFDNAQPNDEFQVVRSDDQQQMPTDGSENNFDLTSIESEIDEMMQEVNQAEQQMQQQAQQSAPTPAASPVVPAATNQNDPMSRLKEMVNGINKFVQEMDQMSMNQSMMNEFHSKMSEMYGESYKAQMDEAKIGELFSLYKKAKGGDAEKPSAKVQETQAVAEVAAPVAEAKPVDEVHGVSLASNKLVGAEVQPRIESGKGYAENRIRVALQKESIEKKMTNTLKENLSLTKQLNKVKVELTETKGKVKQFDGFKKLNEDYKSALEKYRTQLKEMAVLNTNISYVNNLLVNESFALSSKDKQEVIEKFKKIGNILESENTYKQLLQDFSTSKKSIQESIEDKVNSSIVETSSAKVLEESANAGDEHINKILKYSGVKSDKKLV